MKILIAEDDNISRRLLEANLTKKGHEVVATRDGGEAWEALRGKDAPSLAILDWMMPVYDGVEVCRKVRTGGGPYIYLILLTAKGGKEDIASGLEAGADDYIVKPFNPVELHARVAVGERILSLQFQLQEHVEKLEAFDRQKTEFLSMVSHELRTPLAVMSEGVSLLLDGVAGEIGETQRDVITDIRKNIDRLIRLISDLLDLSKIESGKITLRRGTVDLVHVVQQIRTGIGQQAAQKGIELQISLPDRVSKLFADEDKIIQIFNNLIGNAIRYTETGGTIAIQIREEADNMVCTVSDTGAGIAPEHLSKLFTRFGRFGDVKGGGYKGTGLGLVIVKVLVEKHGGHIGVSSEPGKGAAFNFTLKKEPFPSILIIEDDPAVLQLVKKFLEGENYTLYEADTGSSGMDLAKEKTPSLILLDIRLPDINGTEIIGRLRQDVRTRDIPVVAMSGYEVDTGLLERMNQDTAVPFLQKPFDRDLLRRKIRAQWTGR
ncbi:MAG TPA: response regulator [bacterium]|nr:response regulator [bacterium]